MSQMIVVYCSYVLLIINYGMCLLFAVLCRYVCCLLTGIRWSGYVHRVPKLGKSLHNIRKISNISRTFFTRKLAYSCGCDLYIGVGFCLRREELVVNAITD